MDNEHIVRTAGGQVRGRPADRPEGARIAVYRGIPYAPAPQGEHRLRAPGPAPAWEGVRECADFGPPAPQSAGFIGAAPWSPDMSAECLTLNVWSGAREGDRAPVLVWIHGGAYIVGSGAEPTYDGTRLAAQGLVVVSVNYRLGFEGFGHVPGLPDNRGLLDQAAALGWVRDNIAAFGGDPGNVTVAGESAGAGSVLCLMAMPRARGLFHRAIAHSVPGDVLSTESARAVSEKIAAAAGAALTPEEMTATSSQRLLEAGAEVLAGKHSGGGGDGVRENAFTLFAPVADGDVLPKDPLTALARGEATGVDLLVGHNLHEYRLFTELGQQIEIPGEESLARTAARYGLPEGAVGAYRAQDPEGSLRDLYSAMAGDRLFGEYTVRTAEAQARAGGRAHFFRFAFESPAMGGVLRSCHALDLPFAFGNLDSDFGVFLLDGPAQQAHRELSERMVGAWCGFAATGDPGWPAVTAQATPVKVWNVHDELHAQDPSPLRALWAGVEFPPR